MYRSNTFRTAVLIFESGRSGFLGSIRRGSIPIFWAMVIISRMFRLEVLFSMASISASTPSIKERTTWFSGIATISGAPPRMPGRLTFADAAVARSDIIAQADRRGFRFLNSVIWVMGTIFPFTFWDAVATSSPNMVMKSSSE